MTVREARWRSIAVDLAEALEGDVSSQDVERALERFRKYAQLGEFDQAPEVRRG